jgi:hypothetical protein
MRKPSSQVTSLSCLLKHKGDDFRRNSKLEAMHAIFERALSPAHQFFTTKLVRKNPKLGPPKNMIRIFVFFLGGRDFKILTDCADRLLRVQPIDQVSEHLWIIFWQLEFLVLRFLEAILESSFEVWNAVT